MCNRVSAAHVLDMSLRTKLISEKFAHSREKGTHSSTDTHAGKAYTFTSNQRNRVAKLKRWIGQCFSFNHGALCDKYIFMQMQWRW